MADTEMSWFNRLRRRGALFALDVLLPGKYVLVNAAGMYLTECHTTGGTYWTHDLEHAIANTSWKSFETTKNDFRVITSAVSLLKVDL